MNTPKLKLALGAVIFALGASALVARAADDVSAAPVSSLAQQSGDPRSDDMSAAGVTSIGSDEAASQETPQEKYLESELIDPTFRDYTPAGHAPDGESLRPSTTSNLPSPFDAEDLASPGE